MNPFVQSLVGSAAKGAVAYDDQKSINERELLREKIRQEQVARQNAQIAQTQQNFETERTDRKAREDADRADREQRDAQQGLEHGIVPRSTNIVREPNLGGDQPPAPAPFDASKLDVGADNATPSLLKPATVPKLPHFRVDETAAHYDEDVDPAYQRGMDVAVQRAKAQKDVADARNARMLEGQKIMAKSRTDVANIAAKSRAATNGAGGRPMTGNGLEQHFEKVLAPGMLQAHGGDVEEAIQNLTTTEEGRKWMAKGFTPEHLRAEYDRQLRARESGALRLQSGQNGMLPEEAVGQVGKTRDLLRKTPPPHPGGAQHTPVEDIGPVTDAEVLAAIDAKVDPGDGPALRAYIKAHRTTAKKP